MTLTTIPVYHIVVCWIVFSLSLTPCYLPALISEVSEELSPGYQNSPILVSVDYRSDYPLAWYNLRPTWFLNVSDVEYTIQNPTAVPIRVQLTSQYPGYSTPTINVITIDARSTSMFRQFIILDVERIQGIRTPTRANLYYTVEYRDDDSWILHEAQTKPVTFYPMDQMVWATEDSRGKITIYHGLIATFVTPQSRGVADLLAKAKERATSDSDERYGEYRLERRLPGYIGSPASCSGAKNYTNLQVKAIYNALKYDYNLSYVHAPVAFGMGNSQRVSIPDESLSSGSANCIDGAVLFASALERIGIRPYIIIRPDHAYIAWDIDSIGTEKDALETTRLSYQDFEDANEAGRENWEFDSSSGRMELYQNLFDMDISHGDYSETYVLVDIDWLRSQGITPMDKRSEEGVVPSLSPSNLTALAHNALISLMP